MNSKVTRLFFRLFVLWMLVALHCSGQPKQVNSKYEQFNPEYHFFPSGDPTGLFYNNGLYYNNWGSATSKDFVHWNYTAFGLNRNKASDISTPAAVRDSLKRLTRLGGSGSIVIDVNNTSGFGKDGRPPWISLFHNDTEPWRNQVIDIAYSNDSAKSWTVYGKNPVLDINSIEFRDPKVFWYEPTKKWIMAVCWAEIPKIKFYCSSNLKDWEFLSDFGPSGAVAGVWECVDLFQLPIDNDPEKLKWVMVISVQPLSGQYFIGDFDGRKFTLDPKFMSDLHKEKYIPKGEVLFDFETGLDNWKMEGDAFIESPSRRELFHQGAIMGKEGLFFVNSSHNGSKGIGKITSPEFEITRNYINFLVGGGYAPNDESVNLIVGEKIVRSQTGNNSGGLQWAGWDVSPFKGQRAKIEITDKLSDGPGRILADHFMLCDEPAKIAEREDAFWIDYGPDFYAARAWNNYAPGEKRIIWTGWMGCWRYAGVEPVSRMQSVPRTLTLKTYPEGVRLLQYPIKELESLRKSRFVETEKSFEGVWVPKNLKPARNAYEIEVEFENISSEEFGLKLCVGGNEKTVVGYCAKDEELYVDRRHSGLDNFSGLFPQINKGPLKNKNNNTVKIRIFVDKCCIEVFGNDGETVISSKIYPAPSSVGIELFSNNGIVKVKSVRLWELDKIRVGMNPTSSGN